MASNRNGRPQLWATILALALCVPAAWAQQKDPRTNPPIAPLPPLSADESSSKADSTSPEVAPVEASQARQDRKPLSGAEEWAVTSGAVSRDYLLASFNFFQGADTNAGSSGGNNTVRSQSIVGGDLAYHRLWDSYELTAMYDGSGRFYTPRSNLNGSFHNFRLSQKFMGRRWALLLSDQVSYSPDARGGAAGFGRLPSGLGSAIDRGLGNVGGLLLPNQSILTSRATRVSNAVLGQLEFYATRRSSFTFGGSYGILRFLDSGFIDGNNIGLRTGYNYAVTGRDTVAVSYGANLFRYVDSSASRDSHFAHLAYGRRITGRLAFHVAGGPQITLVDNQAGSRRITSWSMDTGINYRFPTSDVSLSYRRGVTGGSGLLFGAETNEVRVTLSRRLSRLWSASLNAGYAHNESLRGTTAVKRVYDSWHAGLNLRRPLGRHASLFFRYSAQQQFVDFPGCVGTACGSVRLRHVFGIGFNFRLQPIEID